MATISENLQLLINAKEDMKLALIDMSSEPVGGLTTYAEAIRNIPSLIIERTEVHDLEVMDYNYIKNMVKGDSFDCVFCNSNITNGYVLGYNGTNTVQYLNGFRSKVKLILSANECIEKMDYVFTVTQEENPSEEILIKHFTVTGANFTLSSNYLGYTDYRVAVTGNVSNILVTFDGSFPLEFYVALQHGNKSSGNIVDSNGVLLCNSIAAITTTSMNNFTKVTMRSNMTLNVNYTNGGKSGWLYIRVPNLIEESKAALGQFSIKHKATGKYLAHNDITDGIEWVDLPFYLTFWGFTAEIADLEATIAQPIDTSAEDLTVIVDIDSLRAFLTTSATLWNTTDEIDETCLWTLYKLIE